VNLNVLGWLINDLLQSTEKSLVLDLCTLFECDEAGGCYSGDINRVSFRNEHLPGFTLV